MKSKSSQRASEGMCAGNAVFNHTEVGSESKIEREMLCFTIDCIEPECDVPERVPMIAMDLQNPRVRQRRKVKLRSSWWR